MTACYTLRYVIAQFSSRDAARLDIEGDEEEGGTSAKEQDDDIDGEKQDDGHAEDADED